MEMFRYLRSVLPPYSAVVADDRFGHFTWMLRYVTGMGKSSAVGSRICRLVFAVFPLFMLVTLHDAVTRSNTQEALQTGIALVYLMGCILKVTFFNGHVEEFDQLQRFLSGRRNIEGEQMRAQNYRFFRMCLLWVMIIFNVLALPWIFIGRQSCFHFPVRLQSSAERNVAEIILDLLFGFSYIFWDDASMLVSLTCAMFMRALVIELQLLAGQFEELFRTAVREDGNFWPQLHAKLDRLIHEYVAILHHINLLRKITRFLLLVQILGSESMVVATFLMKQPSYQTGVSVMLTACNLLESYFFCYLIEQLNESNGQIAHVLYCSNWPQWLTVNAPDERKQYRSAKAKMLLCMVYSQQRVVFRCVGMYEISMETFKMVLQSCYTILTFLHAAGF